MYLIQYGELALKGKNRKDFEDILKRNIEKKLSPYGKFIVQKKYGKFLLDAKGDFVEEILSTTPGIHHFAFVKESSLDLDNIKKVLDSYFPNDYKSFRMTVTRTNKNFPIQSMEIAKDLGAYVYHKYHLSVDLHHPEVVFWVNIAEKSAYIYYKKNPGL
ncbi:MAG: hypothetical protein GXP45_03480 [bacterium]|nr:hypothetical protein [bacterium]